MLLMKSNTRSGGVGQGHAVRASGRSAAQSLDGRWSGGYFHPSDEDLSPGTPVLRPPMPNPTFSTHLRTATAAFTQHHPPNADFPLATDSMNVHEQQPVKTSVFAVAGCRPLIPDTFTLQVASQLPFGGEPMKARPAPHRRAPCQQ